MSILIIDDSEGILKGLKAYMETRNYDCECVRTVSQALSLLEKRGFDVILTDIYLEGFSGISLIKSIKGRGDITPIIFMSGYDTPEMIKECMGLGAHDFLAKPFRLTELDEILANILRRKQRLAAMGVNL